MQLQQFVTETVENLGGMVMPVEYALCHVLIPETYASYFQNKTEHKLSFDFEVAQENPDSEFVTFGSYVLEQLLAIVRDKAKTTIRYAAIERLELGNPQKKIKAYLQDEQGKIIIEAEQPIFGVWAVFQYHTAFIADEKTENTDRVWINMLTNDVDSVMKQNKITLCTSNNRHTPIQSLLNLIWIKHSRKQHHMLRKKVNNRKINKSMIVRLPRISNESIIIMMHLSRKMINAQTEKA